MTNRGHGPFVLALLALLLVFVSSSGCSTILDPSSTGGTGQPGDGDDDDSISDDDDSVSGDDDDATPEPVEQDCADGIDDDGDGLVDCADSDCADVFHCTWPETVHMHTRVDFDANDVAKSFDVGDCTTEFEGELVLAAEVGLCTDCDLSYEGTVSYGPLDNCPEEYVDRPPQFSYGFVFQSVGEREVWSFDDETASWENLGTVTEGADGSFQLVRSDPVLYEVPIFGEVEVGTMNLTQTFTDF